MTIKALTHTTPVPLLVYFLDLVCTRDVRRTVSLFYGTTGLKLLSTLIPLDKSARNLACSCGFTKPISLRSVQTFTLTGLKRVVTNLTNAAAIFVPPGQFTKYKRACVWTPRSYISPIRPPNPSSPAYPFRWSLLPPQCDDDRWCFVDTSPGNTRDYNTWVGVGLNLNFLHASFLYV